MQKKPKNTFVSSITTWYMYMSVGGANDQYKMALEQLHVHVQTWEKERQEERHTSGLKYITV